MPEDLKTGAKHIIEILEEIIMTSRSQTIFLAHSSYNAKTVQVVLKINRYLGIMRLRFSSTIVP